MIQRSTIGHRGILCSVGSLQWSAGDMPFSIRTRLTFVGSFRMAVGEVSSRFRTLHTVRERLLTYRMLLNFLGVMYTYLRSTVMDWWLGEGY